MQKPAKYNLIVIFFLRTIVISSFAIADDNEARRMMEIIDQQNDDHNRLVDIEMILIDQDNNQRPHLINSYSKDYRLPEILTHFPQVY